MFDDIQQTALVTGGGSGIGLAIAQAFVNAGIRTIIAGRDTAKLQAAKNQLGELCEVAPVDLADLAGIPAFTAGLVARFGSIHVLVNNAGINLKKPFTEVTDEEFARILQTNVSAVFALSREVVKHQIETGIKGSIINISSMASQYGLPKVIAYTASKSAIEGMTRAMATELSPYGIRTNCIAPGFIATEMSAKALNNDPERKAKVMGRTPMGFMGDPGDIGQAALFLAGTQSRYITGVVLPVDGGNSIGF
jgi:NAD(P)-dependent dehydrogenase (short-subunit alcohol dehydrogenase family)